MHIVPAGSNSVTPAWERARPTRGRVFASNVVDWWPDDSETIACFCLATLTAGMVFAALPAARSQQTRGPITPKTGEPVQQAPEGTIRVRVELVRAPVVVIDAKGEPVLDLQQKDFHVVDEDADQTIESFDLGGDPVSAVLVFETSSRIAPLLTTVRKSAIIFTQTVVGPSGEGAVLSYDDGINRLLPFSMDNDKIEKTIANLKPGNSGARLYDALAAAVGLLRDRPAERRRAIIVVGEAKDSGSEEKLGQVLREAQLSNIVIYSVGLSTTAADLRAQSLASPARPRPRLPEPLAARRFLDRRRLLRASSNTAATSICWGWRSGPCGTLPRW